MGKDMNKHFMKEDIKIANKRENMSNIISHHRNAN